VVTGVRVLEAAAEKAKGEMQSRAEQHILITGACGAGKPTLGKALSRQLQLPLHRLDDDPDFRQLTPSGNCPG
jgi:adenylylsulfate kinase-like enzyme